MRDLVNFLVIILVETRVNVGRRVLPKVLFLDVFGDGVDPTDAEPAARASAK